MEEFEASIIELIDDNNESSQYEHIMTLTFEEKEYVVLAPVDEDDEDEAKEVVILRIVKDENDEDVYQSISDEQEEEEVYAAFLEVLESEDVEQE